MRQKRLELGESHKITVMGFLLIFCLLATFYFQFILKIEIIFTHVFLYPSSSRVCGGHVRVIAVAVFLALLLLISHVISPLDTPLDADVTRALMFVIVGTVVAILPERKAADTGG